MHTPFCGPDGIRLLPTDVAELLCRSLASGPAGFHTNRWAASYVAATRAVLGDGAAMQPFKAALGPDVDALDGDGGRTGDAAKHPTRSPTSSATASSSSDPIGSIRRRTSCAASSRTTGCSRRGPGLRGRVVFVAMVYPSRQALPEYLAYANEIEQVVDRVNDRWATRDWLPIVFDPRDDFSRSSPACSATTSCSSTRSRTG